VLFIISTLFKKFLRIVVNLINYFFKSVYYFQSPGCVCVCTKRNVAFAFAVAVAFAFDFFKRNPDKSWAILNQRVDHMLFR